MSAKPAMSEIDNDMRNEYGKDMFEKDCVTLSPSCQEYCVVFVIHSTQRRTLKGVQLGRLQCIQSRCLANTFKKNAMLLQTEVVEPMNKLEWVRTLVALVIVSRIPFGSQRSAHSLARTFT